MSEDRPPYTYTDAFRMPLPDLEKQLERLADATIKANRNLTEAQQALENAFRQERESWKIYAARLAQEPKP